MKVKFNVQGMHCKSCEMLIQDALEDEPGVKKILVSSKKNTLEVEFNESLTNTQKIKTILAKEGYDISE